ncbi:MAG: hypothetical protein ACP5UA_11505 [Candidatus Hydrogenedens sp.]
MQYSDSENPFKDNNEMFWLSIDKEGFEIVKENKGIKFIEDNKESIVKETKIEILITNILKNEETCPDKLIEKVINQIQQDNPNDKKNKKRYLLTNNKIIKLFLPLCAGIVFVISILSVIYISSYIHTSTNKSSQVLQKSKTIEAVQKPNTNKFEDIIFSSFEKNLSNSDSKSIQDMINSKVDNISINIKDFLETNNDYQLIGYMENELEGGKIIQVIFDYKGDIVRVLIFPYSPQGIDLIKPAIENGVINDIKKIENYFVSILGETNANMDFFQYITPNGNNINSEVVKDNEIRINSNNFNENTSNDNASKNKFINTEGTLFNEENSSTIYDNQTTNDSSTI